MAGLRCRAFLRTADLWNTAMIDPRVVQPVTRVMPKGTSAATAAAEPARDGATTTPHALPPGSPALISCLKTF